MPKGPEYELQSQIAQLAHLLGWETIAFRPAMTKHGWRTPGTGSMARGWPDMTLVHQIKQRLLFAELKAEDGKLSDEQGRVLGVLSALSGRWRDEALLTESQFAHLRIDVKVWKPSDWPEIERTLR